MLLGTLSSILALTDPHELQHTLCTRMALAKSLGLTHTSMTSTSQHQHPVGVAKLAAAHSGSLVAAHSHRSPQPWAAGAPARSGLPGKNHCGLYLLMPPSASVLCQPSNCGGREMCS